MRKLLGLVLAAMILTAMQTAAFAAFAGLHRTTMTATVQFLASDAKVWMDAKIYNVGNGQLASPQQLGWSNSGIQLGITKWKASDQYILLFTSITNAGAGVQIYTDNKASDASPAYTGSTGNPCGLVCVDSPTVTPLPMCWRITDISTDTINNITDTPGYTGMYANDPGLGSEYPCFLYMKDKQTYGFQAGEDYATLKDTARGIQHAAATWSWSITPSPDYVYIGANFSNALAPRTYRTSTLRIESFTE